MPSRRNKIGLSFEDSPVGGEDANTLFIFTKFACKRRYQYHYEDNWHSDQSKHEEKSKAHHNICLLSRLYDFSINVVCKGLIKLGQRFLESFAASVILNLPTYPDYKYFVEGKHNG